LICHSFRADLGGCGTSTWYHNWSESHRDKEFFTQYCPKMHNLMQLSVQKPARYTQVSCSTFSICTLNVTSPCTCDALLVRPCHCTTICDSTALSNFSEMSCTKVYSPKLYEHRLAFRAKQTRNVLSPYIIQSFRNTFMIYWEPDPSFFCSYVSHDV
jgi:hypothetical protein